MPRAFALVAWLGFVGCMFDEAGTASIDGPRPDASQGDAPNGDASHPAASCAILHDEMPTLPSGTYLVDLGPGSLTPVYCDMEHFGGGWTLIQRTIWDFSPNAALFTTYADFYQQTVGDASSQATYRLAGQFWPALNARGEHLLVHYPRATNDTRCGPLFYRASGSWAIPSTGPATISGIVQTVTIFDSNTLSTTDNGPSPACVNSYSAAPWTYANCCQTCPTFGHVYFMPPRPAATYLMTPDVMGRTVADACGSATPVFASGFLYGDDAMEYYVR